MPSSPNALYHLVDLLPKQSPGQQMRRGAGHLTRQVEQQGTQQVRHHHKRSCLSVHVSVRQGTHAGALGLSIQPRQRLRAQVKATHVDLHFVHLCVLPRRRNALTLVVQAEHRRKPQARGGDRQHSRTGADIQQRPRPMLECPQLQQQLQTQAGGGMGAGPERLPGVDHDLLGALPIAG